MSDEAENVRPCQLVILSAHGRIDLTYVRNFVAKKTDKWTGSFELERGTAAVDDLFYALSGSDIQCTMYQYIMNADESTTAYQYTDAMLNGAFGRADGVAFSALRRMLL
jgi:hypothetical protein